MRNNKIILTVICILIISLNLHAQTNTEISRVIKNYEAELDYDSVVQYLFQIATENPDILNDNYTLLTETLENCVKFREFTVNFYFLLQKLIDNSILTIDEKWEERFTGIHFHVRDRIKSIQTIDYQKWIWDDYDYEVDRYESEMLLVLLGYKKSQKTINELKLSLEELFDNRLKLQAAIALINFNEYVSPDELLKIAEDDETRQMLFSNLKRINRLDLFPEEFKTQEALARSEMVVWLVHPKTLGRTPEEIELIQVITFNYENEGDADFYLWKFKSKHITWVDHVWVVGLSGPFLRKDAPTDVSHGYTYSDFLELKEKTVEEHFKHIVDYLEKEK